MEHVLQDLIAALRGSGVRISVSESIDAMNALRLMGYDNKQILKASLSATLAKSRHDKVLFDSCFDRFYSLDDFIDPETNFGSTLDSEPAKEDSPLTWMLLSGDNMGLSLSMREAARETDISSIWFFTQKSLYIQHLERIVDSLLQT